MDWRSGYNYDRDKASEDSGLRCNDHSLAQQNQKEEADINTIVKRFNLSGELPNGVRAPRYGDFTEVTDFQTALNQVNQANEAFLKMPASIRKRFGNDPEQFVAFCSDETNREEAIKMGLVFEEGPAEGAAAVAANPATASATSPEPAPAPAQP